MNATATATPESWEDVEAAPVIEPEGTADPASEEPPEETAETSQPGAAAAESQPEKEAPSGEEPPAPPAKGPATTAEPPESKPFAFTVDRTRRDVPEAIETADGWIAMPRTSWDRHVQPNLRDPAAWQRERADYQRQLAEARDLDKQPVVQQARLFAEEIAKLENAGVEGAVDWAINFLHNLPVLKARAEAAAAKSQLTRHEKQLTTQQEQQQIETIAAELPVVLNNEVTELLKDPEFTGLGLNAEELVDLLWEIRQSIFFEAPEDDPDQGVSKGEILYRRGVIRRLVKREADAIKRTSKAAADAAAARAKNAAVLGKAAGNEPPPAVSAKGSPAPAGKKPGAPKTKDEWLASLHAKD